MKKLMFALVAAAGVALGAYAEEPEILWTQGAVSFEEDDPGVSDVPGVYDLDSAEFDAPEEAKVWYTAAEENPTEVREYGEAAKPAATAGDNFLHVETDAKPLFRTFANAAGIGHQIGAKYIPLDKVMVDTWVKFTAWDSEPTFAADDDAGATKFALWLQTSEDETQTNLFVKCGSIDGAWNTTPTNVVLDVSDIDVTAWHHVVVKTILDKTMPGGATQPGGLGCFTIAIDGAEVAATSEEYAAIFPAGYEDFLNAENKKLAGACKLFPSMVKYDDAYAGTLFGVGFQGTGDIDLLSIAPVEVDEVEITFKEVTGLTVAKVETEDGEVQGPPYMVAPGTKVTVTYAPNGNYILSKTTVEYTINEATEIDPAEDVEVEKAAAKIGTALYLTLNEAFNAAIDKDEIEMLDDVTLSERIFIGSAGGDKDITLDLAGKEITWDESVDNASGVFIVRSGSKLTVEDSSNTNAGKIDANGKAYAAIAITHGTYQDDAKTASLIVNGGTLIGYYQGITGNGTRPNTYVEINDGVITATATDTNLAIFNPQADSTVVINGGEITGLDSAIEMRGGTLTVNDGTLTATAEAYAVKPNGSGSTTAGAALAVAQHTTKGDIAVEIKGGTLTGVNAVSVANPQGNTTANVAVTLGNAEYDGELAFSADGNATVTNDGADLDAPEGYKWDEQTGILIPCDYVAQIGDNKYETLAAAFAAVKDGETAEIALLKSCSGAGIFLAANAGKTITLDLGGFTYTCVGPAVGSNGTASQAFHLEKGNTVTIKDGTVTSTENSGVTMLVQNYCDLTVTGVTLDGSNLPQALYWADSTHTSTVEGPTYTMSNNSGTIALGEGTVIKVSTKTASGVAFDTCKYATYDVPSITVDGATINGDVELSGGNLTLTAGTLTGALVDAGIGDGVITKAAGFTAAAPAGYKWDEDGKLVKDEGKEIKPGEIATDIEAKDAEEALSKVTIKPINDEAAAAGQAAVITGKATQDGETGKWTVEPVINEKAPEFKEPDLVVETTLEQMVAGTDGAEVTVALPAEKVTPGLYYSVDVSTELGEKADFVEGERVLATGTGVSLKVTKPTGGKAFFKVSEHMAPTPANVATQD